MHRRLMVYIRMLKKVAFFPLCFLRMLAVHNAIDRSEKSRSFKI